MSDITIERARQKKLFSLIMKLQPGSLASCSICFNQITHGYLAKKEEDKIAKEYCTLCFDRLVWNDQDQKEQAVIDRALMRRERNR